MTYSSSLSIGRRDVFAGRNQNVVSFQARETTLGPISNTIMLVVLACLLGLLYLTQVTKTNAYGYKINTLEQQQTQLESQRSDLQVASARLQSLDRVASSTVAKNLVAVAPSATIKN